MASRTTPRKSRKQPPPAPTQPAPEPAATGSASVAARPLGWRDLGLVFLLALAVRLACILAASKVNPFFDHTLKGFDQHTYQQWALAILKGDWLSRQQGIFYYSPLYPYFAATIYKIFGLQNFWALHLVQALLGAATCTLGFVLADTWLGRRGAWLAAVIWALAAPFLFYEQELLHEGLMLASYTVVLWGLRTAQLGRRVAWARLLAAGAACAVAMIGRGNGLALLLALPVWIFFAMGQKGAGKTGLGRWGGSRALLFLAGAALIITPLLLRNHAVAGHWYAGMPNGKVLFYLGNSADATGEFGYSPRFEAAHARRPQDPGIYLHSFFRDLKESPGAVTYNLLRKNCFFFTSRDMPDNLNFQLGRRLITPLHWTPVQWEWLMPLGLVGISLTLLGRRREWSLLWVYSAGFAASVILILPVGRYRMPILIPTILAAAFAIEWMAAQWAARSHRGRIGLAVAAWGALVLALWPWPSPDHPFIRPNDYNCMARAAIETKRYGMAERVIEMGFRDYPGDLSLLYRRLDVAVGTDNLPEMKRLADLFWQNRQQGIMSREVWLKVGEIYARIGQTDLARTVLESLLQAAPDFAPARARLAQLEQAQK